MTPYAAEDYSRDHLIGWAINGPLFAFSFIDSGNKLNRTSALCVAYQETAPGFNRGGHSNEKTDQSSMGYMGKP
jgi:hypothetical protein